MGPHRETPRVVGAVKLTSPIALDGKLDEEVWRTAPVATDFRQSQPDEGQPATQKTEVRFAYDDEAIYVGARMFDTEGGKGVHTRLMRRDAMTESDSDILQVVFDAYHDHQSSYFFWVNPSGSKRDGTGDQTCARHQADPTPSKPSRATARRSSGLNSAAPTRAPA